MKIDISGDVFKDLSRESLEEFSVKKALKNTIEVCFH